MSDPDEVAELKQELERVREDLGTWRLWAAEVLFDWGGYQLHTREDAELRALLALTFGFTLACGGIGKIQRDLRALVAHQQGVVRLTEAILGSLDERPADGIRGRSDRAADHRGDGADGAAETGQVVQQGAANGDQGGQPKL
jgi:hypothetical protein